MYIFHYDKPNNKWNVFFWYKGGQDFVCAFNTLAEAQQYCEEHND